MSFAQKKKSEEKILDFSTAMQGTLSFKDPVNLRINGNFEGNLDTQGTLTIGPNASVTADISGDTIVIAGKVKGKIQARDSLTILSTAVIDADIFAAKLSLAEGAKFDGTCTMLGEHLNAGELAKYLEVEENRIIEWADTGKIPAVKQLNQWQFDRKAIDEWIAAGKITS
jgi:excisionase family DNA binding protein